MKEESTKFLMSESKAAPKSFARRDHLRGRDRVQAKWAKEDFEVNPDSSREISELPLSVHERQASFGPRFALTKAEFTARFQRLQGKCALSFRLSLQACPSRHQPTD